MVFLVLIVCIAASPETCREEQPPLEAHRGLFCLMEGELVAAALLVQV
jgi:hypothetical protein